LRGRGPLFEASRPLLARGPQVGNPCSICCQRVCLYVYRLCFSVPLCLWWALPLMVPA